MPLSCSGLSCVRKEVEAREVFEVTCNDLCYDVAWMRKWQRIHRVEKGWLRDGVVMDASGWWREGILRWGSGVACIVWRMCRDIVDV